MKTKFNFNIKDLVNPFGDNVTSVKFNLGKWGGDIMEIHIDLDKKDGGRIPINDIIKVLDNCGVAVTNTNDIYDGDYGEPYLYTEFKCIAK